MDQRQHWRLCMPPVTCVTGTISKAKDSNGFTVSYGCTALCI